MTEKLHESVILKDDTEVEDIVYKSKIRNYVICGFLAVLAQLFGSGHAVLIILFIKNIKLNIIVVAYYRAILSSLATLAMAYFLEGKFSLSYENFNR